MIQRQQRRVIERRQKSDLIAKHEKIGKLLGLETVPLHELAWKEERLDLGSGDCYPIIDVLERIAEKIGTPRTDPPRPVTVENVIDPEVCFCECGFSAKSKAGLTAHKRKCKGGDEK